MRQQRSRDGKSRGKGDRSERSTKNYDHHDQGNRSERSAKNYDHHDQGDRSDRGTKNHDHHDQGEGLWDIYMDEVMSYF